MHRKPNRLEGGLVFDWLTAMLRSVSHMNRSTVPIPKYWSHDFFQKEAESSRQGVGNPKPYLFSLPLSRLDRLPRRWGQQAGVHRLSMTHVWEAAKFDDACTVPTPCLLLSETIKF